MIASIVFVSLFGPAVGRFSTKMGSTNSGTSPLDQVFNAFTCDDGVFLCKLKSSGDFSGDCDFTSFLDAPIQETNNCESNYESHYGNCNWGFDDQHTTHQVNLGEVNSPAECIKLAYASSDVFDLVQYEEVTNVCMGQFTPESNFDLETKGGDLSRLYPPIVCHLPSLALNCVEETGNRTDCTAYGQDLHVITLPGQLDGAECTGVPTLCVRGDGTIPLDYNETCLDSLSPGTCDPYSYLDTDVGFCAAADCTLADYTDSSIGYTDRENRLAGTSGCCTNMWSDYDEVEPNYGGCKWVYDNTNVDNEVFLDWVVTPAECIALVKAQSYVFQSDRFDIANFYWDDDDESTSCYGQYKKVYDDGTKFTIEYADKHILSIICMLFDRDIVISSSLNFVNALNVSDQTIAKDTYCNLVKLTTESQPDNAEFTLACTIEMRSGDGRRLLQTGYNYFLTATITVDDRDLATAQALYEGDVFKDALASSLKGNEALKAVNGNEFLNISSDDMSTEPYNGASQAVPSLMLACLVLALFA